MSNQRCFNVQYFVPGGRGLLLWLPLHGDISLKEIISQIDQYLASLSSKTYSFEDKMTEY